MIMDLDQDQKVSYEDLKVQGVRVWGLGFRV